MKGECPLTPSEKRSCRQRKPYSDTHHTYYPRNIYNTAIEKAFRELPDNKEQLCRCEHSDIHATELPPEKPSVSEMRAALGNAAIEGAA